MPICFIYNAFETILNFSNIDNKMRNVYWKSYFHIKSGFQYKKLQYLFIWVSEFQTPLLISKCFKISNEYPQHIGVSEFQTPLYMLQNLKWVSIALRYLNVGHPYLIIMLRVIGMSEIQTFEYLPTQKYNYRYLVAIYCKSVRNSDILVSCFSYYMDI